MYLSENHSQHSNLEEELSQTHHLPEEVRVYYSPQANNLYTLADHETPAKLPRVQDSQDARTAEKQPQSKTDLNFFCLNYVFYL